MHCRPVQFTWDPAKDESNRRKHGIAFDEAKGLWSDPRLVILPSRFPSEPRNLAIGKLAGKHWTAIFTERGHTIRLISTRRSRDDEKKIYDQNQS